MPSSKTSPYYDDVAGDVPYARFGECSQEPRPIERMKEEVACSQTYGIMPRTEFLWRSRVLKISLDDMKHGSEGGDKFIPVFVHGASEFVVVSLLPYIFLGVGGIEYLKYMLDSQGFSAGSGR